MGKGTAEEAGREEPSKAEEDQGQVEEGLHLRGEAVK